eukprot:1925464-Amphidinium_carterae.3
MCSALTSKFPTVRALLIRHAQVKSQVELGRQVQRLLQPHTALGCTGDWTLPYTATPPPWRHTS